MFVSIYYKPSLFNAHTMILIVHIFTNVDKLCLNQMYVPLLEFTYLVFSRMRSEEDVPVVEFTYLVCTRMPGESYRRRTQACVVLFALRLSSAN